MTSTLENKIHLIRGMNVMLDFDLAELYDVKTKRLNEAVKRNLTRFPGDFMFQLTDNEIIILRSQIATSSWGGHRYKPMAFTEQGVAMLSGILKSERAIHVNIAIMRAFVSMRNLISSNKELEEKLKLLEFKSDKHDQEIQELFNAIRILMSPPTLPEPPPMKKVGYKRAGEE